MSIPSTNEAGRPLQVLDVNQDSSNTKACTPNLFFPHCFPHLNHSLRSIAAFMAQRKYPLLKTLLGSPAHACGRV